jgi:hypothetical protein
MFWIDLTDRSGRFFRLNLNLDVALVGLLIHQHSKCTVKLEIYLVVGYCDV